MSYGTVIPAPAENQRCSCGRVLVLRRLTDGREQWQCPFSWGKHPVDEAKLQSADDIQWLDDGEELSEMLDGGGRLLGGIRRTFLMWQCFYAGNHVENSDSKIAAQHIVERLHWEHRVKELGQ